MLLFVAIKPCASTWFGLQVLINEAVAVIYLANYFVISQRFAHFPAAHSVINIMRGGDDLDGAVQSNAFNRAA